MTETSKLTEEQQTLVEENLKLVHYFLKRSNFYNNYEDFYQAGVYGLCLAAQRFDESKGFEFTTFATCYIQGHIKRHFRDFESGPIKPLRNGSKIKIPNYLYIDGMINDNGDCYGYDFIDAGIENEEETIAGLTFNNILVKLSEREQDIIKLSLACKTQMQIAEQLSLSQAQISRLLRKLQKKFKKELNYEGYLHDLQRGVGRKQIHNREQLHMSTLRLEDETQCNDKTRKEAKEIALYSDSEICMLYRDAKNKKNQIEIIKQLTGYSDLQIEYILKEGGCLELKDEKKAEIMEQYNKGLSDKAISREVQISQSQVSTFLRGQGLPPNGKRFPGKTESKVIIDVPEVVEEIHETVAEVKVTEKIEKEEDKEMPDVTKEAIVDYRDGHSEPITSEVAAAVEEIIEEAEQVTKQRPRLSEYEANMTDEAYLKLAILTLEILKGIWG